MIWRNKVLDLLREGFSYNAIATKLGCSKSVISFHAKKHGFGRKHLRGNKARKYNWIEIQKHYDLGHSVRECMAAFGFSMDAWWKAKKRGDIQPRPRGMPLNELLVPAPRGRTNVKRRLIAAGLLKNKCELCPVETIWNNRPLVLVLDHIDGNKHNFTLTNLRLLCPNCNSQTSTFSGRNTANGKALKLKHSGVAQLAAASGSGPEG